MDKQNHKIKIVDGSFGFQLSKYVSKSLDNDPLWSARSLFENPEQVAQVHLDYIKAGCDIIETNTYQASVPGFMKYLNCTEKEAFALIKKAVDLVKSAKNKAHEQGYLKDDKHLLIAGSIGPYGAFLHDGSEYSGDYIKTIPIDTIREYHISRIEALVEGGIDLFAIETIPTQKEAEIIMNIIQKYPYIKAWLSFSCKTDGVSTAHGENFKNVVKYCYDINPSQLIAIGVNCIAPHAVETLLKGIDYIPLIVYANSGEQYDSNIGWHNNSENLEDYISTWLDLGVKYIGGCCRICDQGILKIVEEVNKWEKNNM